MDIGALPFDEKLAFTLRRAALSMPELRESIAEVLTQKDFEQITTILRLYGAASTRCDGVEALTENTRLLLGDASSDTVWNFLTFLGCVHTAQNEKELDFATLFLPAQGNGADVFAAMLTLGSGEARTVNGHTLNMREDLGTPDGIRSAAYKQALYTRAVEEVERQIDSLTYDRHGAELAQKTNAAVRKRWTDVKSLDRGILELAEIGELLEDPKGASVVQTLFEREKFSPVAVRLLLDESSTLVEAELLADENTARVIAPSTDALSPEDEVVLNRKLSEKEEKETPGLASKIRSERQYARGKIEEISLVRFFGRDVIATQKEVWEKLSPKKLQAEYLYGKDDREGLYAREQKAILESKSADTNTKRKAIKTLKEIAIIRPIAENLENFDRNLQPVYGTNPIFFDIITEKERQIRQARKAEGEPSFKNPVSRKNRPIVVTLLSERLLTEIDTETRYAIVEGSTAKKGKVEQAKRFLDDLTANPLQKPLFLYAPNLNEGERKEIEHIGGDHAYVFSTMTDLEKWCKVFLLEYNKAFKEKRLPTASRMTEDLWYTLYQTAHVVFSQNKREPILREARDLGYQHAIDVGASPRVCANIMVGEELKNRRRDLKYVTALNEIERCVQAGQSVPEEHVQAAFEKADPWNKDLRRGTFFGVVNGNALQFVRGSGARMIVSYDIEEHLQGREPELGVRSEVHPNGNVQKIQEFSQRREAASARSPHLSLLGV